MPRYNNHFGSPDYVEETIFNDKGIVGTIRIKPSSILWKPKGTQKFYAVPLDSFITWISNPKTKARKTSN